MNESFDGKSIQRSGISKETYFEYMKLMHPLKNKSVVEIFPLLNYLNFDESQNRSSVEIKEKEEKEGRKSDRLIENLKKKTKKLMKRIRSSDDPIKELGNGINSFH